MQYPAYDPDGNVVRNAVYSEELIKRRYNAWHTYEEDLLNLGWCAHEKMAEVMNALPDIEQRTDKADLACGTGLLAKAWRRQDMVGYDLSYRMVELSRASGRYARVSELNINRTPLPKKYDLITACGLFGVEMATAICLPNIAASLKDDGILLTTMPQHQGYYDEAGWQFQTSFELIDETEEFQSWLGENSGTPKYHKILTWRKVNEQ